MDTDTSPNGGLEPDAPSRRGAIAAARGYSPFFRGLAESGRLDEDALFEALKAPLGEKFFQSWAPWDDLLGALDEDGAKKSLRELRRFVMAHLMARDLGRLTGLDGVMAEISGFADFAIRYCARFAQKWAERANGPAIGFSGDPVDLTVVAMGKLGGRELNVSSDVDLIFTYPEEGETAGPRAVAARDFFAKAGRKLIAMLDETTAQGRVFRVDMRLRPDGDSSPLAISEPALEQYLIRHGRDWERYAWIKARVATPGANDVKNLVRPFIYRKYLDFNAYEGMRSLHEQILREADRRGSSQNVKIGKGGIREVEFFAQIYQLIRGGRCAKLQTTSTLEALKGVSDEGFVDAQSTEALTRAYRFLRETEHRLQYRDDVQTQTLPSDPESFDALAQSMGFGDPNAFRAELGRRRAVVAELFGALISRRTAASDMSPGADPFLQPTPFLPRSAQTDSAAIAHRKAEEKKMASIDALIESLIEENARLQSDRFGSLDAKKEHYERFVEELARNLSGAGGEESGKTDGSGAPLEAGCGAAPNPTPNPNVGAGPTEPLKASKGAGAAAQDAHDKPEGALGDAGRKELDERERERQRERYALALETLAKLPQAPDDAESEREEGLKRIGFENPKGALGKIRGARMGMRYRRSSENAKRRFDALLPQIAFLCALETNGETAFSRSVDFVEGLLSRSAYLAFLQEKPLALRRLTKLLANSGFAADYLARHPILLDDLLGASLMRPDIDWAAEERALRARIAAQPAGDVEAAMDAARHFQHSQVFRLVVQDMNDLWTVEHLSDQLTHLADAILRAALDNVWARQSKGSGMAPKFAVIGYGKLGGKEMSYTSDLDLVFLYDDASPDAGMMYSRLAGRIATWLTAATGAGKLYDVDLRLRPHGDAGLPASGFDSFAKYQRQSAWTWELQALTRARFVCGDAKIGEKFERLRAEILSARRDPEELKKDIVSMRRRAMAGHKKKTDNVKYAPGGVFDLEFIVQYLTLAHSREYPSLMRNYGNIALLMMSASFGLIDKKLAGEAIKSYRFYRWLQHNSKLAGFRQDAGEGLQERFEWVLKLWDSVFGDAKLSDEESDRRLLGRPQPPGMG